MSRSCEPGSEARAGKDDLESEPRLVIVGGGPAGLSAAIYAARSRLHTTVIEKGLPGGQIVNAEVVENYPGFPDGVAGAELGSLLEQQARKYGAQIVMAEVEGLEFTDGRKKVRTSGGDYPADAVIIASGSEHGRLNVPGEDDLTGRGVSYCAVCDGAFFREQPVAIVGGGNVALNDAIFLTRFASKVIVVHRRDELRATRILQERAFSNSKIEFLWDTVVDSIAGNGQVQGLNLRNLKTGERSNLNVAGVFVAVGLRPNTGYLVGLVDLSPDGFILVDESLQTRMRGIFAAGDIRAGSPRQVICAAGDGAAAAIFAERYLASAG